MDIDERIMDKVLADVKEIIAEPDGTIRFIFYSPYSDEVYRCDTEFTQEERNKLVKAFEEELNKKSQHISSLEMLCCDYDKKIKTLNEIIEKRNKTISELEGKLAGGRHD